MEKYTQIYSKAARKGMISLNNNSEYVHVFK